LDSTKQSRELSVPKVRENIKHEKPKRGLGAPAPTEQAQKYVTHHSRRPHVLLVRTGKRPQWVLQKVKLCVQILIEKHRNLLHYLIRLVVLHGGEGENNKKKKVENKIK
jgi:hypothetical protein